MSAPLVYRRYRNAATHVVDSDIFLVTRTTIKHLNATAAVIWLAIEEPATRRDVLEILRDVFPAVDAKQLGRDLDRFLRIHAAEGLVVASRRKRMG
jgi:Coenzyme PQQ synthesis protein D (PqqD)